MSVGFFTLRLTVVVGSPFRCFGHLTIMVVDQVCRVCGLGYARWPECYWLNLLLFVALTLTLLVLVFTQLSLACGCEVAAALIEIPTLLPRISFVTLCRTQRSSTQSPGASLQWLHCSQPTLNPIGSSGPTKPTLSSRRSCPGQGQMLVQPPADPRSDTLRCKRRTG